ncbi:MAG: Dabb family protein [Vicinamibacterales bacterium]|nr:Dabb family protein [Acidobacteriota bacterium]
MIKHIVFWRLRDGLNGLSREQIAREMQAKFEAMVGVVPGLHHLEFGIDFNASDDAAHCALYTEFDSREALDAYQASPEHMAVVPFIRSARTERRVVDYEVP